MNTLYKNSTPLFCGAVFIILLCVGLYVQSISFDFLNLDDNRHLTQNPVMYHGISFDSIKWAFTTFSNPYYMPITRISFLLDSSIYGVEPLGFHLSNLILHILNALLVLYLFWLLSNELLFSIITATLFAIHPQHIEAFIWISERKEVLSTFFGLLSLIFYVTHIKNRSTNNQSVSGSKYYFLAILFFLFSLLSKPAWITMPFIFLLIDWWPLKRIKKDSIKLILIDKIPFLLIVIIFSSIIYFSAASSVDYVINSAQTLPLTHRLLNSSVIYITYLFLTIYPVDLPVYFPYPRTLLPLWEIIGSIIILVIITVTSFYKRKTYPALLTGWLWFLGTLIPMIGILSPGESVFIANRWTYLPHIGFIAALVWTGVIYTKRYPNIKTYLGLFTFFIFLALSISSWNQTKHWENSETFWKQAIRTTENNHYAYYMLGTYYLEVEKTDEALSHIEKAYQLESTEGIYALQLGSTYLIKGETDKAWEYYKKIIELGTPNKKLLFDMGLISLINDKLSLALEFFQAAIETPIVRQHHLIYEYLAMLYTAHILSMQDSSDEAMIYMKRFIESGIDSKLNLCLYAKGELQRISKLTDPIRTLALVDELCISD